MTFFVDKIGLTGFPCNEITLTKFLTIEEQLNKKPTRQQSGEESIASTHPLQRLNKKFNQYLHSILHQKINKEITELKQQYLKQLEQLTQELEQQQYFNNTNSLSQVPKVEGNPDDNGIAFGKKPGEETGNLGSLGNDKDV